MNVSQVSNYFEKKLNRDLATTWMHLKKNKSDNLIIRRVRELDYGCFMSYWGIGQKKPTLVVDFNGGIVIEHKSFKNIDIEQKIISKNKSRLLIQPKDISHNKIFEKYFPLFFINKSKQYYNSTQLNRILLDIKEFAKLISLKKTNMSKEQIKGLFGELLFFREKLNSDEYTYFDVVNGWQKNGNKNNDFVFENIEYEVKTSEKLDERIVHISSEYQLYSFKGLKVFLCYKQIKSHKKGSSLDQLIQKIKDMLSKDKLAYINFNKKLLSYGYFSCKGSKNILYSEINSDIYEIDKKFPKLTVNEIPRTISNIKYTVKLPKISK